MKIQKYPSINGLRAISIILVILSHLSLQYNIFEKVTGIIWLLPLIDFLQDGHLGVNIFFVISGFLITSLLIQEEINTNTVSLKNFYIRRTLRIFPAYYFLLIVYLLLQLLGCLEITKASWFTAITYTKYFNWQLDWYTGHFWSLSIEEQFYIFWPFIFTLGDKARKRVALFLILIVPFVRIFIKLSQHYYPINWLSDLSLFSRIDSIATGCFFALHKNKILRIISVNWSKIFFFSILILFFLRYFPILAKMLHIGFIFIPLGLTHGTIANVLISLILMYSVFGPKGTWHKLLNLKIADSIGLLSYSLYLWQQIFTYRDTCWQNRFPQNLLYIIAAALCSYYFIEKPFLKLKSKFSVQL